MMIQIGYGDLEILLRKQDLNKRKAKNKNQNSFHRILRIKDGATAASKVLVSGWNLLNRGMMGGWKLPIRTQTIRDEMNAWWWNFQFNRRGLFLPQQRTGATA